MEDLPRLAKTICGIAELNAATAAIWAKVPNSLRREMSGASAWTDSSRRARVFSENTMMWAIHTAIKQTAQNAIGRIAAFGRKKLQPTEITMAIVAKRKAFRVQKLQLPNVDQMKCFSAFIGGSKKK